MLPIRILVRYDTKIADLSYLKPSDCSVVSIINDAWKEMSGKGVQLFNNWKLSVLFPWNGQRHTVISDEELMIVFETFDNQSEDEIEFEISLNPLGVEYPEEHIGVLTSNNEAPPASENNVTPPATVEEYDSDEDDSYEVDKETGEDNEVLSLASSPPAAVDRHRPAGINLVAASRLAVAGPFASLACPRCRKVSGVLCQFLSKENCLIIQWSL
ncbi:hypothetical protein ACOSP7_010069 [Xanthoceras sorbifolium]